MSKIARQSKDYRIKNMPFCTRYHKLISKRPNQSELWETNRIIAQITNLVFNLVCPGKSRLEYCLDNALRSPSPLPLPPWAGSKVGRAAVVIFLQFHALFTSATLPRYSNECPFQHGVAVLSNTDRSSLCQLSDRIFYATMFNVIAHHTSCINNYG